MSRSHHWEIILRSLQTGGTSKGWIQVCCMQKLEEEEVDCEKGNVPLFVHKHIPMEGLVCYLGPCLGWGFALITGVGLGGGEVVHPISEPDMVQGLVPCRDDCAAAATTCD